MLAYLIADTRYAFRRLRARIGYAALAVLTLALGIAGTTAAFGIARPLIFDPLPYANAKDVASFWYSGSWTEEEFVFLRGKFPGFRAVTAYRSGDVTMREPGSPTRLLTGIQSSAELFDVLGARPFIGRGFATGDDRIGAEPVAVLSYGLWRELGANPAIEGTRITLDGTPRTVVGVMPKGFWFPDPSVRIWTPRPLNPEGRNGSYTLLGHVEPGQDVNNMRPQLQRLVATMADRFQYSSDWDKTKNASVTPLREALLGSTRPAVYATFVAMALILLIACTNVAAIMLGQVESRGSELAVRAALGADRRRLAQPLIVEALLIGVFSAVAGVGLAMAGFNVLARALPIGAWAEAATFDWSLLGVALILAVGAALLVVFVPAASLWWSDARSDLHGALSRSRTAGVVGGRSRIERGLLVVEVALAMLIATGATLLVRSVSNLYAIDPGIATSGVAVMDAVFSADVAVPARRTALNEVLTALSTVPGIRASAVAMKAPLRGNGDSFGITIEGKESLERTSTFFRIVTRDYFNALSFKLLKGRTFDASDRAREDEISVVINEALAQKYYPGEEALGKRVGGGFGVPQRIIGIVANAAEANLTDERTPVRYYFAEQVPWFGSRATFVMQTRGEAVAETVLDDARAALNRVAPGLAVQATTTMARVFDTAVGPARQIMTLLALLSGLALVLGAIGIYGVISHFAQRRRRDWAIRVALGLSARRVVSQIVGQAAVLVVLGIVIGAAGTVALSRLLSSFLFGVSGIDPLAFVAAASALLITGLVAAFVPAWRAGTVDPALVLREDA